MATFNLLIVPLTIIVVSIVANTIVLPIFNDIETATTLTIVTSIV